MSRKKAAGKEPAKGKEPDRGTGTSGTGAPPKRVELFVEEFVRRVVAKGTVFGGSVVHNVPVSAGCSRVSLLEVIDGQAMLPRPSGEFTKVVDAFGSFLEWPENLISRAPAAPSTSTSAVAMRELFINEPTTRSVAEGIVQEEDAETTVKVLVVEVRDAEALIPKPTKDVSNVGQASGKIVDWPRRLATTIETVERDSGRGGFDDGGFGNDSFGDGNFGDSNGEESEPENTAAPRRPAVPRRGDGNFGDSNGEESEPENTAAAPRQPAAPRRRRSATPIGGQSLRERVRKREMKKKSINSENLSKEKAKRDVLVVPEFRRMLVDIGLYVSVLENVPSKESFIQTS